MVFDTWFVSARLGLGRFVLVRVCFALVLRCVVLFCFVPFCFVFVSFQFCVSFSRVFFCLLLFFGCWFCSLGLVRARALLAAAALHLNKPRRSMTRSPLYRCMTAVTTATVQSRNHLRDNNRSHPRQCTITIRTAVQLPLNDRRTNTEDHHYHQKAAAAEQQHQLLAAAGGGGGGGGGGGKHLTWYNNRIRYVRRRIQSLRSTYRVRTTSSSRSPTYV